MENLFSFFVTSVVDRFVSIGRSPGFFGAQSFRKRQPSASTNADPPAACLDDFGKDPILRPQMKTRWGCQMSITLRNE